MFSVHNATTFLALNREVCNVVQRLRTMHHCAYPPLTFLLISHTGGQQAAVHGGAGGKAAHLRRLLHAAAQGRAGRCVHCCVQDLPECRIISQLIKVDEDRIKC